jgi:RNA polymerase sigma-70 factor (ECF subfamily)
MDNFEEIYRSHAAQIFNLCLHYLQQKEEAEEATQDIFVKAHRHLAEFRAEAQVQTWLYRIAVNHCLDSIRRRRSRARWLSFIPFLAQEPKNFAHPAAALEDKEAVENIFACIDKLPDGQRTALILKSLENLPQQEIAEIMGISVKAVESNLSRARANLRANIDNK